MGVGCILGAFTFGSAYKLGNTLASDIANGVYNAFNTDVNRDDSPFESSILKEKEFWVVTATGFILGAVSGMLTCEFAEMFFDL